MCGNYTFLSMQWVKDDIKMENIKYFEINSSENTANQNLWDGMKEVLRRKFVSENTYIKIEKKIWNH